MILAIGEILIDSFMSLDTTTTHIGGAPFNVAVQAKRSGAKVGFIGRVGQDDHGDYIIKNAKKYGLDYLDIMPLRGVATTVAEVVLDKCGERHFRFFRDNTADYQFDIDSVYIGFCSPTILHIGTLMLGKEMGRKFASHLLEKAKKCGIKISIDVNFRDDLFENTNERNQTFKPFIDNADFLKMGLDEIIDYTDENNLENAVKKLAPNGVLFVTDGDKGSFVFLGDKSVFIPSKKVNAIDTTGAGDAYWGCTLAHLDRLLEKDIEPALDHLQSIAQKANLAGAEAVTRLGAI